METSGETEVTPETTFLQLKGRKISRMCEKGFGGLMEKFLFCEKSIWHLALAFELHREAHFHAWQTNFR